MEIKTNVLADRGILTRSQIRSELGLTDETLSKMEREDDFPCRRAGRIILYDADLIKKWIATKPKK